MRAQDLAGRMRTISAPDPAIAAAVAAAALELSQLEVKDEDWFLSFRELMETIKPYEDSSENTRAPPAGVEWLLAKAIDITGTLLQLAIRSSQREQLKSTTQRALGRFQRCFATAMASKSLQIFLDLTGLSTFVTGEIGSVIVVTAPATPGGNPNDAFADTLARYLNWRWGERGRMVVNWLIQFLSHAEREAHSRPVLSPSLLLQYQGHREPLTLRLDAQIRSQSFSDVVIRIRWVEGGVKDYYLRLMDVVDLLSWLIATLKKSSDNQIVLTKASVKMPKTPETLSSWPTENPTRCLTIKILAESGGGGIMAQVSQQGTQPSDAAGWSCSFAGANVAVGFVIPSRPETIFGIELPLSVLISLSGVEAAPVPYKGGYGFKGPNLALFPERAIPESCLGPEQEAPMCLQWHIFRAQGSTFVLDESEKGQQHLRPLETALSSSQFLILVQKTKRHFLR
ncbi:hypothetical protein B0T14DRAFT_565409 [Immersiella caudata]|uniref:Uncharacterized protein n=1 Tax=Immersiella caudata TaxID=314043 RepID=A0AA39WZJ3_9PEZI|nr:hypothetical protein B0T14DRAFT_565409 [Immersiella caudata]